MTYLLDTHTLLWSFYKEEMLPDMVKDIIENAESLYVSIVSLWEIAIKQSLRKLEFKQSVVDIANECLRQDIRILEMRPEHCEMIKKIPLIHSDPFDRMIIAQAMHGKMTLITRDGRIKEYPVSCLW